MLESMPKEGRDIEANFRHSRRRRLWRKSAVHLPLARLERDGG